MTLLEQLMLRANEWRHPPTFKVAHFAFDGADVAQVSELNDFDLLLQMEEWCRKMRAQMKVH